MLLKQLNICTEKKNCLLFYSIRKNHDRPKHNPYHETSRRKYRRISLQLWGREKLLGLETKALSIF